MQFWFHSSICSFEKADYIFLPRNRKTIFLVFFVNAESFDVYSPHNYLLVSQKRIKSYRRIPSSVLPDVKIVKKSGNDIYIVGCSTCFVMLNDISNCVFGLQYLCNLVGNTHVTRRNYLCVL